MPPCTACTLTARPGASPDQILRDAGRPFLEVETRASAGPPGCGVRTTDTGVLAIAGPEYPEFVSFSYITHFVEVRVEPTTRRIRVPRVVSVADCGRVVSPRTARSQVNGGVVWGIGVPCGKRVRWTPGSAASSMPTSPSISSPSMPISADIDVDFIDEPDPLLNDVGVKGLGEVALVGVAAAIANAVYHATGRRMRRLPIRIEDLL